LTISWESSLACDPRKPFYHEGCFPIEGKLTVVMLNALLMVLLFLTSLFLILLVLIQRGRGGGLAGAFGGLGGQSAFGTKAGDLFTRVTIGVAAFWIILCAASVKLLSDSSPLASGLGPAATAAPGSAGGTASGEAAPGAAGGAKAAPAGESKSETAK
jgi:preprotein translocase subunit SecG